MHENIQGAPSSYQPTATVEPHIPHPQAAGGQAQAQAQGRMRSSIACIRCRRSKVKCVNNGIGTTCRTCDNSGRECSYPSPLASGSRRRDSLSGRGEDGERRQRARKSTSAWVGNAGPASRESSRPILDALDMRVLTPTVWQELFDIFQIHYSADLPFLHPPTFLRPLRQAACPPPNDASAPPEGVRPPASTEFLLAFLALTARFHPKLVAHHSPSSSTRASNPLIASDYYAAAANRQMANLWSDNRAHNDINRVQATLMLGLHEWGMCRGAKAWLLVGIAIRCAQAMGLQYELELDDEPMSRSLALKCEAERMGVDPDRKMSKSEKSGDDAFIQQEIRRRTFWSCYIMDRYLSSGKYRPQMLLARELRIQLPASERSFLFAEKVRTLMLGEEDKTDTIPGRADLQSQRQQSVMLGTANCTPDLNIASPRSMALENDEEKGRMEIGPEEGLVSRYVKVLEIYGKVIKWACSGGRRIEEWPPWDPRCNFFKLRRQCQEFKASLPRQNALTPQNTQAHISMKTSTPYTLVHAVYLLCQIMLHREYVPFIPIRCAKPEGPVDPPLFPADKYLVPPGFWEDTARQCFKSAREIIDLVRTCQEWSALVETPIIGFAIYTVAFNGVYCINFPWMDPDGYMCTASSSAAHLNSSRAGESQGFEAARKALEMIGSMRPKLHMADGWFKTINKMHKYFRKLKSDYRKSSQTMESSSEGDSPISTRHLSLREGGSGGGLSEFRLLERTLQEFGNLEDEDVEMGDLQHDDSKALDEVYDDSRSDSEVKSEGPGERLTGAEPPRTSDAGTWSAINTAAAPPNHQPTLPAPVSQFRSYDSYPQRNHQQTSPQGQETPHHGYSHHHANNLRPTYSDPAGGAPPTPASHSAAGTTPSVSQPSPPYENRQGYLQHHQQQQHHTYQNWPAPTSGYPMQPPPPNPYVHNPPSQHLHHHAMQVTSPLHSAYSSPGHAIHASGPLPPMSAEPQHAPQQQPNDWAMSKEAWLNSLDTRLGGDDVAAFVDGGEMREWVGMAASQGFGGWWLSTVWGGGNP